MKPLQAVHIVGLGAVTPAGAQTPVAMAAIRAGLSRILVDPEDALPDDPDANNIAPIATLSLEERTARARVLLALAVEQALAPIPRGRSGTIRVLLAGLSLPDALVSVSKLVVDRLRVVPVGVEHVGEHGASSLLAAEKAFRALAEGTVDFALVAGVDIRTDAASVAAGVASGRVIGPLRSWGYVPGEAGAAVLFAHDRTAQQLGLRSHGCMVAVASGHEPHPLGATVPCIGRGLTDVIQRVLEPLPSGARVLRVFCDLNGERHRSDEWGFTVPRIVSRLRDAGDFTTAATGWGDCGAANGLLLLALATTRTFADQDPPYVLVWTSSDGSERAATVLRLPETAALATLPSGTNHGAPPPLWAKALDEEILAELVDECSFRYNQRAYQLGELADAEPPTDWSRLERTEAFLDTLAVGLADCGSDAWNCARACLDPALPGTVYVAARLLLESGRDQVLTGLATGQIAANPAAEAALSDAYQHAVRAPCAKDERLVALLQGDAVLSLLALRVAAFQGLSVPEAWLAKRAPSVPHARGSAWAAALGRIGDPSARRHLSPWLAASEPALRRDATVADLLLGGEDARRLLLGKLAADGALLLPAALVVDVRWAASLLAQSKAVADHEAILAVAMAGDANAVPWLLAQLDNATMAGTAAAALEILLGVCCFATRQLADEDETAPPRAARTVSHQRSAWEALANPILARHPRTARLRGGVPATREATMALLDRPHLPPLVRRYLGHELALRWGAPRSFDPTAPRRIQRGWLESTRQARDTQPAGSWAVQYPGTGGRRSG